MKQLFDVKKRAAHIVDGTKELVDWLLSMNTHNRTIKASHIITLKRDILAGNWEFTNQGIGVSASGVLNDGQHRLMAIAGLGYPPGITLLIVTGLSDKAQAVVDRSAKRSQADVIKLILNRTISNHVVGAINVLLNVKSGSDGFVSKSSRNGRTSDFEVADYMAENAELFDKLISATGSNIRVAVMAALTEYALRYSLDSACELGSQIKTGAGLMVSDPAYRLRQYLSTHKGGGGSTQVDAYAYAVTACIAHARGESLGLLRKSASWDRLPKRAKAEA